MLSLYASVMITVIAGMKASAQLSPAIPPSYFGPSSVISPVLLPNPVNPTCQVLIFIKTLSTTNSSQQDPTAEQVASSVTTGVDYQCENLNSTDTPAYSMGVEVPLDVLITNAVGATLSPGTQGANSTLRFEMTSSNSLPALGAGSRIVNTTVLSANQDVLPRNVYINGSRCAIAVAGANPAAIVPSQDLFSNLRPSTGSG